MELLQRFKKFIEQQHLFTSDDLLLLAVSGGVDSVVLCELCHQAGYAFAIAHCNFQLRGAESESDEAFVRQLAVHYSVPLFVKKFETATIAAQQGKGIQETARNLRYEWFMELASALQAERKSLQKQGRVMVCTAHQANDNIETLLMNFFKGTGISGLHGIAPRSGKENNLLRPLLFAKKEELHAFATGQQLKFAEDSSNISDKYTRNYFRNQLIPALKKVFPQVEENLLDNLQRFTEIEMLYQQSIALHKKKLIEQKGNELHIPVLKLKKTLPLQTVLYEIIKDFGFHPAQVGEVIHLLDAPSGKYVSSATARIIKNRRWLIITPMADLTAQNILIEEGEKDVPFAAGHLKIETTNEFSPSAKAHIACIDADDVHFPLLLRQWKQGDYFYPLGMQKKKKLSRFFIDQKLSKTDKEKVWVLEMNKKIVWVIGKRIDDRFKISPSTKNILRLTFTQSGD